MVEVIQLTLDYPALTGSTESLEHNIKSYLRTAAQTVPGSTELRLCLLHYDALCCYHKTKVKTTQRHFRSSSIVCVFQNSI